MKNSMYVVTHKQVDIPEIAGYKPIVVGKNEVSYSDFVRDNTGDNIAEKNPNYCELTALYWMWKNDQKSDLVGLSHYRRFFSTNISNARKDTLAFIIFCFISLKQNSFCKYRLLPTKSLKSNRQISNIPLWPFL